VVREARARATDSLIRAEDLPYRFRTALEAQESPPPAAARLPALDEMLTKVETRLIALALERSQGNKSKAAELLGVHRARLIRRVEQLGLGAGPRAEEAAGSLDELSAELMHDEPRPE
jgi:DNA-binding NtrC family response regulator